jgi:hypothetical protein
LSWNGLGVDAGFFIDRVYGITNAVGVANDVVAPTPRQRGYESSNGRRINAEILCHPFAFASRDI